MKSSDPIPTPVPPEVDRVVIHQAMKQCGGNVAAAFRLLKEMGVAKASKETWLHNLLRADVALKAVWVDQTSSYSLIEAPGQLSPAQEQALAVEMAQKEQEFIDSKNIDELFGGNAEEALAFARFAEESFSKSINVIHGLAVHDAFALHKRAEWIEKNVLLDETDDYEHTVVADDGTVVTYKAPKYSESDKLEWQKEYTIIMAELRKFADTGNKAALARIKAQEIAEKMQRGGGDSNKKSGRGGRKLRS